MSYRTPPNTYTYTCGRQGRNSFETTSLWPCKATSQGYSPVQGQRYAWYITRMDKDTDIISLEMVPAPYDEKWSVDYGDKKRRKETAPLTLKRVDMNRKKLVFENASLRGRAAKTHALVGLYAKGEVPSSADIKKAATMFRLLHTYAVTGVVGAHKDNKPRKWTLKATYTTIEGDIIHTWPSDEEYARLTGNYHD